MVWCTERPRKHRGDRITSSSSALYFSASYTIFSISSALRRPLSLVMVILLFLPASTSERSEAPLTLMQASQNMIFGYTYIFRTMLFVSSLKCLCTC